MSYDKYGPHSLYVQIEEQKARAVREHAEWEAAVRRRHQQWQTDNLNKQLFDNHPNSQKSGTQKKSGWLW